MVTIKAYTDIVQSKKLAEFLPIESADMWWNFYSVTTDDTTPQIIHLDTPWVGSFNWDNKPDNIPCWSLAALLEEMPEIINFDGDKSVYALEILKEGGLYYLSYGNLLGRSRIELEPQECFVDACYEMIIKLHEQKIL